MSSLVNANYIFVYLFLLCSVCSPTSEHLKKKPFRWHQGAYSIFVIYIHVALFSFLNVVDCSAITVVFYYFVILSLVLPICLLFVQY